MYPAFSSVVTASDSVFPITFGTAPETGAGVVVVVVVVPFVVTVVVVVDVVVVACPRDTLKITVRPFVTLVPACGDWATTIPYGWDDGTYVTFHRIPAALRSVTARSPLRPIRLGTVCGAGPLDTVSTSTDP